MKEDYAAEEQRADKVNEPYAEKERCGGKVNEHYAEEEQHARKVTEHYAEKEHGAEKEHCAEREQEHAKLKDIGDATMLMTTKSGVGDQRFGVVTMRALNHSHQDKARS